MPFFAGFLKKKIINSGGCSNLFKDRVVLKQEFKITTGSNNLTGKEAERSCEEERKRSKRERPAQRKEAKHSDTRVKERT